MARRLPVGARSSLDIWGHKERYVMQLFRFFFRRSSRAAAVLAVAVAALSVSAAQADDPGDPLRAYGTAVVDGAQSPGEWEGAAKMNFAVNVPPSGTTPATLYVMNNGVNLYLAVKVGRSDLVSGFNFWFDNDHDGSYYEEGDDVLILNRFGFVDMFVSMQPPCPPTYTCIGIRDTEVGGTSDGAGVGGSGPDYRFYELSHPLDTPDDGHDFSLRFGKRVSFGLFMSACASSCAPTSAVGDILVTSASTIAPETQITRGPTNGSFSRQDSVELTFTGSDDAIAPEDLRFECNQNGGSYEPCSTPFDYTLDREGPQSFGVRAIDEVGNVDSTPTVRRWTFDTQPPGALSIRGPRVFKKARVVYRLAATDEVDRPKQLRFKCSLDRGAFRRCPGRLTLKVRPGRHQLRVMAVDRTGNVSNKKLARFVRVKSR
jgi:hypothetical protein